MKKWRSGRRDYLTMVVSFVGVMRLKSLVIMALVFSFMIFAFFLEGLFWLTFFFEGPNHTLPTGGSARSFGGLSFLTFTRVRTWMRIDDLSKAEQMMAVILFFCLKNFL